MSKMNGMVRWMLIVALSLVGATVWAKDANKPVGLDGYCPVAYKLGKAVKGLPEFSSEYEGTVYRFPSAQAKHMFDEAPASYSVSYDGWSAVAMATGKKVAANPTVFEVYDGHVYRFASEEEKSAFDANRDQLIAKADRRWAKMSR